MRNIVRERNVSISDLLTEIDTGRNFGNLSSAIRLFVLNQYLTRMRQAHQSAASVDSPSDSEPYSRATA